MKTLKIVAISSALLISLVMHGSSNDSPLEKILPSRGAFSGTENEFLSVCSAAMIPCGLEVSAKDEDVGTERRGSGITIGGKSLAAALNEITERHPYYRWRLDRKTGAINMIPRRRAWVAKFKGRDPLQLPVSSFSVNEEPSIDAVVKVCMAVGLWPTKSLRPTMMAGMVGEYRKISLHSSRATAGDVLNRIAAADGAVLWIVRNDPSLADTGFDCSLISWRVATARQGR